MTKPWPSATPGYGAASVSTLVMAGRVLATWRPSSEPRVGGSRLRRARLGESLRPRHSFVSRFAAPSRMTAPQGPNDSHG